MNPLASPSEDRLYTSQFAQVFCAVFLFMVAVALQFHIGQYVHFIGHGVDDLGRILSVSMIGTLCIRLQLGRWIDRLGCKPTWVTGAVIYALATAAMQLTDQLWLLAALRAVAAMSQAAVLTAVAVLAAQIAPAGRRAESIGSIGLAGLAGIMVGPTLGDLIFSDESAAILPYRVFFLTSAAGSLASAIVILLLRTTGSATAQDPGDATPGQFLRAAQRAIIFRHWPGMVLLVGMVFSMVFTVQSSFLERFADARGFYDIKVFFLFYSPTAIILRIVFRRLPQRFGRSRTLLMGMLFLAAGLCALIGIETQVALLIPGILMGAGHCFIWPSMVDLAAERLPPQYRGTGTALILGAGDLGMVIGFASLGELIDALGFNVALTLLAAGVLLCAALFAFCSRQAVFETRRGKEISQ